MSSKLLYKISSYPTILIFAGGFVANCLVQFIFAVIFDIAGLEGKDIYEEDFIQEYGLIGCIIFTSIVAPIVETFIFQWLPIWSLCKIKRIPYWIPIVVSAVFFGWAHLSYSVYYMIITVAVGYVFASLFVVYKIKKRNSVAFWFVTLLHALSNLTATILRLLPPPN
ncbi:MAG: CPBP family intramembrane metalloprotease [Bacteroidales bacterium]|jgi:membrane protease YdiL (CAAX protease family)|nr:CPBP family intramembrane metalloprotease [Bacteroidales bacterium]